MAWNTLRYNTYKIKCSKDIADKRRTATYYMEEYKQMIENEDYEAAKAITDVLKPLHYNTADTHNHIRSLKH